MKNILLILLMVVMFPSSVTTEVSQINVKGVVVVHYNATWNSSNNYTSITNINGAKILRAWIDKDNTVKESEDIHAVPTVILYNDGREVQRWEADLSMRLRVHYSTIQTSIDKLNR
jgi:hypothetical protein